MCEWSNIKNNIDKELEVVVTNFKQRLNKFNIGRANISMVDELKVEVYDEMQPLKCAANISLPSAQVIHIKPYDKTLVKNIHKSLVPQLKIMPVINGDIIQLTFPSPTEEGRIMAIKELKGVLEEYKITARKIRKNSCNQLKKCELSKDEEKSHLTQLDDAVRNFNYSIEALFRAKEKEMMNI